MAATSTSSSSSSSSSSSTSARHRLADLMEAVKAEVDALTDESLTFKRQRDDLEQKLALQINEVALFQRSLLDLDHHYGELRKQYEELKMRYDAECGGGGGGGKLSSSSASSTMATPALVTTISPTNASSATNGPLSHPANNNNNIDGGSNDADGRQAAKRVKVEEESNNNSNTSVTKRDFNLDVYDKDAGLKISLVHNLVHSSVVCCVSFSTDSKFLATGCNRMTYIFDVTTGEQLGEFPLEKEGDIFIRSVCFSPDGHLLATGAEDRLIRIWNIQSKEMQVTLQGHEQDIYALVFTPDGKRLVSGAGDCTTRVWDVETGKCVHVLKAPDQAVADAGVTAVAVSPDGTIVAAASLDRTIRFWKLESGEFIDFLPGHKDSVYSVCFSLDGKILASGSLDKTLRIWDVADIYSSSSSSVSLSKGKDRCLRTMQGHKDFVLSVGFSPNGKYVFSGSKDRTVYVWDVATGKAICNLQGHKNSVISVALSPDGKHFATGSGDMKARMWRYSSSSSASP